MYICPDLMQYIPDFLAGHELDKITPLDVDDLLIQTHLVE